MSERGQYGADSPSPLPAKKGRLWVTAAIVVGIAVGVYALSPGARQWYKTGTLPE